METGFATARLLGLPQRGGPIVPYQKRLPVLRAAERAFVLHKDLALRFAALGLAVVVIAGAWQVSSHLVDAGAAVVEAASTGLASAGFGIDAIDITGQDLTAESDILSALAIAPRSSLLAYDAEAARKRVLALPAISDADIRKAYPDRLMISVREKAPVARWSVDGVTWLVDSTGAKLAVAPASGVRDLPLVIGQGAADDAGAIIRALGLYPELNRDIIAYSRIGDRRWDVLYDTGLRLQLPERGVTQALRHLDALERDHAILERDLSLVDMRVAENVFVRLIEHVVEDPDTTANLPL